MEAAAAVVTLVRLLKSSSASVKLKKNSRLRKPWIRRKRMLLLAGVPAVIVCLLPKVAAWKSS